MKYLFSASAFVTHSMEIEVEADDEESARKLAKEKLEMHYGENSKEFNQKTDLYDYDLVLEK